MGGHGSDIDGSLELAQLVLDTRADYVYNAGVSGGHKYLVWFTNDYYQQLTGGSIGAEDFIAKTFDFLKANQALDKMPAEFDFASIKISYPNYEAAMQGGGEATPAPAPAPAAVAPAPAPSPVAVPPAPVAIPVATSAPTPIATPAPVPTPEAAPAAAPSPAPVSTPQVTPTSTPQSPTL